MLIELKQQARADLSKNLKAKKNRARKTCLRRLLFRIKEKPPEKMLS